jgi:TolB-like protein
VAGDKSRSKETNERLDSWKEIAAYLGREARTVQRWEKLEGLPVHRKHHQKLSSIYAYKPEIDRWWNEGRDASETSANHDPRRPLLAVLPLRNLSGDPEQEYFADGLTEELISQLGRLFPTKLGVIARSSAMEFKHADKMPRQIGRELGVAYILDGSVRRGPDRVRITVNLVRVRDQSQIWSESFDRFLRDILDLQSEVARSVAERIVAAVALSKNENSPALNPVSPDAYDAYLKGRFFWNQRTGEGLYKAAAQFERAIAKNARYARAYAGLADCHALLSSFGISAVAPVEAMPKARAAALKALEIDPDSAEGYASLGVVRLWFDWDWPAAESAFVKSIELNPGYASARQWYAEYLATMNRTEESIAQIRRAQENDPLSLVIRSTLVSTLYYGREFDRSIEEAQRLAELDPEFALAHINIGRAGVQKHKYALAVAALKKACAFSNNGVAATTALGHAYACAGRKSEARGVLKSLDQQSRRRYVSAFSRVAIYTGLGETERAWEWLRKARDERCDYLVHLATEPAADSIRPDPRWELLIPRPGIANEPANI